MKTPGLICRLPLAVMVLLVLSGCAGSKLGKVKEVGVTNMAKPERVLVLPFAADAKNIDTGSSTPLSLLFDANEKTKIDELVKEVNGALQEELVTKLKEAGYIAVPSIPGTQPGKGELLISGRWAKIDEGSAMKRNVIGFGAGQSLADAEVKVSGNTDQGMVDLISFTAHADSGSKPGAAVLGPAGAAAGAGTAATVGANVARGAASAYQSSSAHQAKEIADKIVEELQAYSVKQGWVKK